MPPRAGDPSRRRVSATPPLVSAALGAWAPAIGVGLVTALGYLLVSGPASGVSALLGVAIAAVFFGTVMVLAGMWVRRVSPMVVMVIALTLYSVQMVALLAVYVATGALEWLDNPAVGVTILLVALAWQFAQMLAWRRARSPVFDERTPRS